jgi:hypothetical protein
LKLVVEVSWTSATAALFEDQVIFARLIGPLASSGVINAMPSVGSMGATASQVRMSPPESRLSGQAGAPPPIVSGSGVHVPGPGTAGVEMSQSGSDRGTRPRRPDVVEARADIGALRDTDRGGPVPWPGSWRARWRGPPGRQVVLLRAGGGDVPMQNPTLTLGLIDEVAVVVAVVVVSFIPPDGAGVGRKAEAARANTVGVRCSP